MFFSFDGLDGVGKSTQMKLFGDWLSAAGRTVVTCRDPGSTPLGEKLRALLLDHHDLAIGRRTEMLLYMAARAQLVEQVVRPALDRGDVVVSDRYLLANVVYQGHAGGLDVAELWRIGQTATSGIEPDLNIVLDMDSQAATARIRRPADRMELQGDDFRSRLRAGFLAEASRNPQRIVVIDAAREIDEIQADIRCAAERVLRKTS